jgi:hypothetical protein
MLFRFSRTNYRLISSSPIDHDGTSVEETVMPEPTGSHSIMTSVFSPILYPSIFCGISGILSILLYVHLGIPSTSNLSLYELQARKDLVNLRRPSQFMGLDKVNRTSESSLNPGISIINFPFMVARVDEKNVHDVITDGPDSHFMANGLEVRKIQISSRV